MFPQSTAEIVLLGSSIILACFGLVALYQDNKSPRTWQRRFDRIKGSYNQADANRQERQRSWLQRLVDRLGLLNQRAMGAGELSCTRSTLVQAGYRHPNDINIYYGTKFGLMLFLPLVGLFVINLFNFRLTGIMTLKDQFVAVVTGVASPTTIDFTSFSAYASLIFLALVGSYLPELFVRYQMKSRIDDIWRGFPDALDLLVLCIESGLGIDAALHRVAEDTRVSHPLLSEELRFVSDSIRAGQPRAAALKQFNEHAEIEDIQSFTSLVVQTEKLGGSITQSIRKIAESIRAQRRIRAEEQAKKLPVKLLIPLMLFFFPIIMVVLLLPAALLIMEALNAPN